MPAYQRMNQRANAGGSLLIREAKKPKSKGSKDLRGPGIRMAGKLARFVSADTTLTLSGAGVQSRWRRQADLLWAKCLVRRTVRDRPGSYAGEGPALLRPAQARRVCLQCCLLAWCQSACGKRTACCATGNPRNRRQP